jgi:hypothetical protein
MSDAEKVKKLLSQAQLDFIKEEFGHDSDALGSMSDDEIDYLYELIADIEVDETAEAGNGKLSDRGRMAESIVTAIGNELYRPDGEEDDLSEE